MVDVMHTEARYSVVWFKRDLRVEDHAPLVAAAQQGPVVCLYIIEPSVWNAPDASHRQFAFLRECLRDLFKDLRSLGLPLHIVTGEAVDVLNTLYQQAPFQYLFSHQETGNRITFDRDRTVKAWCNHHHIQWLEYEPYGVFRRLKSRDEWQRRWESHMEQAVLPVPAGLRTIERPGMVNVPQPHELGLLDADAPLRQRGGRAQALKTLSSFIEQRAERYRGGISSPLTAFDACSRLSPYLSWGCLSVREVVQATRQKLQASDNPLNQRHKAGLRAFLSRLYWHCHFIQKLESEPGIETHCMHPGYQGLRDNDWNAQHFEALVHARTGWPFVDACVRALDATGWINFRMRAMLVSVAAYPLWLHWRPVGLWLARQFVDYEPGIHWSQMQMQSGTTGINQPRVYNPIKQALDQDPKGIFVRRWLPCMRKVPNTWLFEPWHMPDHVREHAGLEPDEIARPVVSLEEATRTAKHRLYQLRKTPEIRATRQAVLQRHGSRKRPLQRRTSTATVHPVRQLTLDFQDGP